MMTEDEHSNLPQILEKLHSILITTPQILSVSIIDSPNPLTAESQHLAISRKAFKRLGLFASEEFNKKLKEDDLDIVKLDKLSRVLVILNPDDSKFWNHRKRQFLKHPTSSLLKSELDLSATSLKLKPKSAEPFNHCRWLLGKNPNAITEQEMTSQLTMCETAAEAYAHNYYAWTYRLWLLNNFPQFISLNEELECSRKWLETHISQFSAMNYRFQLLRLIVENPPSEEISKNYDIKKERCRVFTSEVSLVSELVMFYPETESLWCYLKLLVMFCDHQTIDYVKHCKKKFSGLEKLDSRFALRFKETIIAANFF